MRRLTLLCVLFITGLFASAQVQTRIIGDSIDMRSNTGKAELRLENSTDSVNGFLFNNGAGRTQFRHGLVKLSDTLYVVGADTLHLNNLAGPVTGNSVFYVAKKYTGAAHALVAGNTVASINSTNAGYRSQLAKAVPGSMLFSYPDPFSARNAALDAIAAGTISNAQVVVLEGNTYTVGSNDSTKNGNSTGSGPNNGTVADIQFTQASITADSSISSIMKNKVDMYFCTGTALTYINSSYPIYCCFNHDSAVFKSGVYGLGSFYQAYGELSGFVAGLFLVNNRLSVTDFHAREVVLQQWQGFMFGDYSVCNVAVDNIFSTDADVFIIGQYKIGGTGLPLSGSAANRPRQLNIRANNIRFGKGQTPYPDSQDFWYSIILADNTAMEGTQVAISIGNMYLYSTSNGPLFAVSGWSTQYGLQMTVNIDNLVQRDSHLNGNGMALGLMYCYNPGIAINNTITYNINKADVDAPLLGMMNFCRYAGNKGNLFNINVGNLQKNQSQFSGGLFRLTSEVSQAPGSEPLRIKVKGNFISYDSSEIIHAYNEYNSLPYPNRYEFSGRYETRMAGVPVVHFYTSPGKVVAFTDAALVNDGVTPSMVVDSICNNQNCNCCQFTTPPAVPVYIKNVHANAAVGSYVQQVGETIKVFADLSTFFN